MRTAAMMLCACLIPVIMPGCAKAPPATGPQTGRITVGVTTNGSNSQIKTMMFTVDIQPRGTSERIQADAGVYDEDLPPGDYVVRLTRLPIQCRVNGLAERRVTVSLRQTTAVRFSVTCD